MLKFVAIDVGSNALRLVLSHVFEGQKGPSFKRETLLRVPIRLGEDVFTLGEISAHKSGQLRKTMLAFRHLLDVFEPDGYMACATSAMRDAANGPDLIAQIQAEAGIALETIAGSFEAELIFACHVAETLEPHLHYLYIDVGGGSTELAVFSEGELLNAVSFNIGTVRSLHEKIAEAEWERLAQWLSENTSPTYLTQGIGSGGNINKVYKLSERKDKKYIKLHHLQNWHAKLSPLSIDQRIEQFALKPDRADVIVPALDIYQFIMQAAQLERIYVPQLGLADGMIHYLYEGHRKKQKR